MRLIGRSRSVALKFFSLMNLGFPLSQPSWTKQTNLLVSESEKIKEKNMTQACCEVKQKVSETHHLFSPRIMDTGISFDCSWNSRGWQATEGVAPAIAEKTGKIINIVHKSSTCPSCTKKQNERDEGKISSMSYLECLIKHEEHCLLNHVPGSPRSMESSAVMTLYKRSVQNYGLYYDLFIGDGDCSAYREVYNANVYGVTKAIGKEEDVGHVTKRMGNHLRALV